MGGGADAELGSFEKPFYREKYRRTGSLAHVPNMPPTPWQTEIRASGIWAGADPRIWHTLSLSASAIGRISKAEKGLP
jgi:hypothetical protein